MAEKIEQKKFKEWMGLKSDLHFTGTVHTVNEGDIWWCAVGENVGVEINGKNKEFSRPVLIFKKLSKFGFMVVPLTSQPHEGSWYTPFIFKNRQEIAVLAQARVISVSRLYKKVGTVSESDFELVREGFRALYL